MKPESEDASASPKAVARLSPWRALVSAVLTSPVGALAVRVAQGWGRARWTAPSLTLIETPESLDRAEPGRGRLAEAPWRIPLLGWKDILWRTYRHLTRDSLPSAAGGVSFYILLATFPAITAFISVYGLFLDPATIASHLYGLSAILPEDALNLIAGQMMRLADQRRDVLGATLAVSTLLALWSANAGMKALLIGLNVAYSEREKRKYLQRTVFAYLATVGSVIFLAVVVALTIAAPILLRSLGLAQAMFGWGVFRWLMVYFIAAAFFILAYRYGPSRRRARWRWVSVGGAAAALLWMVGSLVFSFFIDHFTQFGMTYGSLGAVIGFMLWVWFSTMVLLVGAELNAEIEHQTALDSTTGPPAPLGERGAFVADTVGKALTTSWDEAREMARAYVKRKLGGFSKVLGRR
jgi:membrane protein